MSDYDYAAYGAFKKSRAPSSGFLSDAAKRVGLRNRYLKFVERADKCAPAIEIGCGSGKFVQTMRAAGFLNVAGVDLSPSYDMVEGCEVGDAIDFLHRRAPHTVGLVVAFDVFEHFPRNELGSVLRLIRNRIRTDGCLVFRVPNMGSPLGLLNQFGDLSHCIGMNEVSVRQLAFDTGFEVAGIYPDPRAYPSSLRAVMGYLVWPVYRLFTRLSLAAFGIQARILTPNLVAEFRPNPTFDSACTNGMLDLERVKGIEPSS